MVSTHRTGALRWLVSIGLVIVWLGLGGWLGALGGKLGDVVESGAAAYLPDRAEATWVLDVNKRFGQAEAMPATVVYTRDGALTDADRTAIAADIDAVRRDLGTHLAADPIGPIMSDDGHAAQVAVLFAGTDENKITPHVQRLRSLINDDAGRTAEVTGPAGVQADLQDALGA